MLGWELRGTQWETRGEGTGLEALRNLGTGLKVRYSKEVKILQGSKGAPVGCCRYRAVSHSSVAKMAKSILAPVRKSVASRTRAAIVTPRMLGSVLGPSLPGRRRGAGW